jgi:hypothetical protein
MAIVSMDPYRSLNPRRTVGKSMVEGPLGRQVDAGLPAESAKTHDRPARIGEVGRLPDQKAGTFLLCCS